MSYAEVSTIDIKDEKTPRVNTTFVDSEHADHVNPYDTSFVHPEAWPSGPERLEKSVHVNLPLIMLDVALIIMPLGLMCKTALCIWARHLDRSATSDYIDTVSTLTLGLVSFNGQLVTLYTIVFATVISTLVRRVALWRAQRGASVAELEQWQASISVPGTIKTIVSLRMFTLRSLGLVFIWCWYYLGSQASSREYGMQDADEAKSQGMTITNPHGPSFFEDPYFQKMNNSQKTVANSYFASTYIPTNTRSTKLKGYDSEGQMKIPINDQVYEHVDDKNFSQVLAASSVDYASAVGLQTYAVILDDMEWFTLRQMLGDLSFDTSYLTVSCDPTRARNLTEFPAGVLPQMAFTINLTSPSNHAKGIPTKFETWYRSSNTSKEIRAMSNLCTIKNTAVSIQALCTAEGCAAKKMRNITDLQSSDIYQTPFDNAIFSERFFTTMLLATGSPQNFDDKVAAQNLIGPYTVPILRGYPMYTGDDYHMDELDVLNLLLPGNIGKYAASQNSTILAMQQWMATTLTDSSVYRARAYLTPWINGLLTIYQQSDEVMEEIYRAGGYNIDAVNGILKGAHSSVWLTKASFHGSLLFPHYALSIPWVVIDFISCGILLLSSIAAVYLRRITKAPDILGYVSSLTRDNPHINLALSASTLTGVERARMMKDVKIKIVDLQPGHEYGKIGVVSVDGAGGGDSPAGSQQETTGKLKRTRMYV